jgi:hypothetical protein
VKTKSSERETRQCLGCWSKAGNQGLFFAQLLKKPAYFISSSNHLAAPAQWQPRLLETQPFDVINFETLRNNTHVQLRYTIASHKTSSDKPFGAA